MGGGDSLGDKGDCEISEAVNDVHSDDYPLRLLHQHTGKKIEEPPLCCISNVESNLSLPSM